MKKDALIIIDVQNDFCPGGALAVAGGHKIIPLINVLSGKFYKVIATQDWHPVNHVSFASTHNKPLYGTIKTGGLIQTLWPVHCVQGTNGAALHPLLRQENIDLILRKGTDPRRDSYSAFMDNDRKTMTGLHYYLRGFGIKNLYFCGLATDYCVYYSACDSKKLSFNTYVILKACRGVNFPADSIKNAVGDMRRRGIRFSEVRFK